MVSTQAPIKGFNGAYKFCSNFYPCLIDFEGLSYESVENAYQAAKTLNDDHRLIISKVSPSKAKSMGRQLVLREDWEAVKFAIMKTLLRKKFCGEHSTETLRQMLLNTGNSYIEETNYWHDNIFGNCTCLNCENIEGQNRLGKLLMELREELRGL